MPQDKNGTGTKNCRYMLSSYYNCKLKKYLKKKNITKTDYINQLCNNATQELYKNEEKGKK